jgi:hypothetical protein
MPKRRASRSNPFLPSVPARGAHFADREREVARIAEAYRTPASRLVVYGERRMGKTSAIEWAAEQVRAEGVPVAIATFATATDPADAARQILTNVNKEYGRDWQRELEQIVGRLRGEVTTRVDAVTGLPTLAISFGVREDTRQPALITDTLNAIAEHVERRGRHLAIALDEFQRVHEWGGEGAEWALKGAFEQHRSLSYVLAGSKRHLIEAMITRKGRALWKQADSLLFEAVPADDMAAWIQGQAARNGVRFALAACDAIVRLAGPRTRDIVQLAREVFYEGLRADTVTERDVGRALESWVGVQNALYAAIWRERPPVQQRLLRALAAEPTLSPTSATALARYALGPKSSAHLALTRLIQDEHVVALEAGGYAFDDPFFRRWVELHALPDLQVPAERGK